MDDDVFIEQQVPSGFLKGIQFNVLTEEDIEKCSVTAIDAANEVTDPRLGFPNPLSQCSTCGGKNLKNCDGHIGIIKFAVNVLNPFFISETVQILNSICPGCRSVRHDLKIKDTDTLKSLTMDSHQYKDCKYCAGSSKEWYPTMKFKVASKDLSKKNTSSVIVEVNEKLPKKFANKNLGEVLPTDYWDCIQKDPEQEESFLKPNRRSLSPFQVYCLLKSVDLRFLKKFVLRPEAIFLSCFPVTPNCHRIMELTHLSSNGHQLAFDERTKAMKKLIDSKRHANELSLHVRNCLSVSKLHTDKSLKKDTVLGKNDSVSSMCGLKWIKEIMLGKRTDYAFRMTVIGDPKISLCEIGVPRMVAENLQIPEYLNVHNWEKLINHLKFHLIEKGRFFIRRKGKLVQLCDTSELKLGDIVYRHLDDGDIVLINRPPSVHQHSLMALSVKVLPINSVVSINPLCCSPLSGDFDGDCLHGFIAQAIDCRVELRELVALSKQLVNGQNGQNLLSLSHDSLSAAHLVTQNGVFLDMFQMQQLKMLCPHQLQIPVILKAPLLEAPLWTGKQLFDMLLPQSFDYVFPSSGVKISNGELLCSFGESSWLRSRAGSIFSVLVDHYQNRAIDFLFAAQDVFCEWISMGGFSVSLSDIYIASDSHSRKNMLDEVRCGLQEIKKKIYIKQLMVDPEMVHLLRYDGENTKTNGYRVDQECPSNQESVVLCQVSVSSFREAFHDIQSLIHQYASNDNSLLAMLKAGSKGNLLKIVQQGLCLGLQHASVPLSFQIPCKLSCASWNYQKSHDIPACSISNIPYAVVENSFLDGLNPLECFVHSVSTRDNSFGENADLPGTLTRKLMFYMRDLYIAYDGTVRTAYGNQLVQFSYGCFKGDSVQDPCGLFGGSPNAYDGVGGQPVGSLSACSISEAAYSALDQPISKLEISPLLNLKKVLECGQKNASADQTASLFLSKKLGRWICGFEYGATEVKNHLERVFFSDVVSTVMVIFSPQRHSQMSASPWVCHFHVCKEMMERRGLNIQSIIDALQRNSTGEQAKINLRNILNELRKKYKLSGKQVKIKLPNLMILSRDCTFIDQRENGRTFCIVVIVEITKDSSKQLDTVRDLVVPFLSRTVIKGFLEFKSVDILWNDLPQSSKSHMFSSGELYLKVFMSEDCERTKFWSSLQNACLPVMDLIDWERSYPDNIYNIVCAYGIDAGWKYFLRSLKFALSDIGKTVLLEHLLLVANSLSFTGEFLGLSAKGIKRQMDQASVSSPFMQACFSNPGACFIKAAKEGAVDDLQGILDSVSWGKKVPIGTGGHFDILYSGKGFTPAKPTNIYSALCHESKSHGENVETGLTDACRKVCCKWEKQSFYASKDPLPKGDSSENLPSSVLRSIYSREDVLKLNSSLKHILHKYPINDYLSEVDKSILLRALYFHPKRNQKMGTGPKDIKVLPRIRVGYHSEHQQSRCFMLVRTDGTIEDFSYRKCILGALEKICPQIASRFQLKGWQS
ncbi:PREDICTED: DNA-directed RNA polymerase IV subunit 1 isoform X3 [Nelumbo nucifera]|uniref:DNA-directed RNA polymerase subunit n=2 Tax=Nelumbo nucifera TaxID=4432 RepID=A0A1U8QBF8_NELNU|nr:PREDICTED: DNA-directed RNA polymerase IV subunit 1 isoform X3 [Nelumbo nucifera]